MDSSLKVTDQPQETAFDDVVAGDNVINIPLFQRSYRWEVASLNQFWDDMEDILDEKSSSQFLGVLVLVSQVRAIGRPVIFDVVDGQQRLSTCYLFLLATAYVAARNDHSNWAVELAKSYLLLRPFPDNAYNTRLVPAFADRQQFKIIWDRFRTLPAIADPAVWQGQAPPTPPAPAGPERGKMLAQFDRLVRRLSQIYSDKGLPGLESLASILLTRLSFVQISLRDPTAAPTIFERLNARGERITTSDLVRNEIFARVASDPSFAQAIFSNYWEPFMGKFSQNKIELDSMLFPYGLLQNPSTTKAVLFQTLRQRWAQLSGPQEMINDLDRYSATFLSLEVGLTDPTWNVGLANSMLRLHEMRSPSSIYSFFFAMMDAHRLEEVAEPDVLDIISVIESFLFRRAICGFEPTGLHAVFKGMWRELRDQGLPITGLSVRKLISSRTTVPWPTDMEFRESVISGDLYSRRVNKFALREYERSLPGETPQDDFEIEHVAPQTTTDHWLQNLGEDHKAILHTWANLVPITRAMNPTVGQQSFEGKRATYAGSMFATTRELSNKFTSWGLDEIQVRANEIADWAVTRWKYGPVR